MSYSITWSPTARITYYQVLEYLDERWTIKEIEAFISRTEEVINYICDNPLLYPYSKESDIHKCVVVKQVRLFYRVRTDNIELLVFWDNRQDPVKLLL
ncbi:type II toxin-antitoxin system RelE/ParE family toxin [Arcticibacter tournemirensis]|uniref:Type II toxin-antitoxin system RelE/ParE family toxin n=1 Tax=Arcticibacter tournemirensis TaxID=699437 RepID=A0A4Q0MHT1_9SPHI|nr:type II toxin-antitoxin system RelE/ParE family toxin [Arcticibacter tournemirensis]RXF72589.1 type II toxin-antitoxin system RelE/ParE family toxin [Arcticibacter tournemirensis]